MPLLVYILIAVIILCYSSHSIRDRTGTVIYALKVNIRDYIVSNIYASRDNSWRNVQAPCVRHLLRNAVRNIRTHIYIRLRTLHCVHTLMSLLLHTKLASSAARTASYNTATDSLPPHNACTS